MNEQEADDDRHSDAEADEIVTGPAFVTGSALLEAARAVIAEDRIAPVMEFLEPVLDAAVAPLALSAELTGGAVARALAGTPAMLMIGAAIGPILGGTLVQFFGYSSLGIAALIISAFAVILYSRVQAPAASVAAAQGVAR